MTDDEYARPPADGRWLPLEEKSFETFAGPLFWLNEPLPPDEPFRIGFRVGPKHCNPNNVCHGGMMATFLDMALGHAVGAATKAIGPTMSLTIDYLSPAALGDWIESRSRLVHATYRTAFSDVIALGPKGPVARGNGIFRITRPKQD